MQYAITLPNSRRVGLRTYCESWRTLQSAPPDASITGWDHFPTRAADILHELRRGIHDRINRHERTYYGRGRKWSDDWQRAALQCARAVNTPRLIVDWIPHDLRARLAHRLRERE